MRTTKKQRDEAKKGCEFWIKRRWCVNHFCVCMYELREKLKKGNKKIIDQTTIEK